jgi:hypothetical protein
VRRIVSSRTSQSPFRKCEYVRHGGSCTNASHECLFKNRPTHALKEAVGDLETHELLSCVPCHRLHTLVA